MRTRDRVAPLALGLLLASACSPADSVPSTTIAAPSPTTTTSPATTATVQGETVTVILYPFTEMADTWTESLFPYGETEDLLGTAPGGDGLTLGPEYGTQTGDGVWWFMDAAKLRVARYGPDGNYLDQLLLPDDVLVNGQYFQFQNPIALDDGRVIATGFRDEDSSELLLVTEGDIGTMSVERVVPWVTTDGTELFGFSVDDQAPSALDPSAVTVSETGWFQNRDGSRYMVTIDGSEVVVDFPDQGVTKTLQLRFSDDLDVETRAGIEVETGVDGTMFMLFYGAPLSDETVGVGGLVTISADGVVSEVEPITSPFTSADPGSPAHLGVTPGTSDPWIMVIAEDGVHVYTRRG